MTEKKPIGKLINGWLPAEDPLRLTRYPSLFQKSERRGFGYRDKKQLLYWLFFLFIDFSFTLEALLNKVYFIVILEFSLFVIAVFLTPYMYYYGIKTKPRTIFGFYSIVFGAVFSLINGSLVTLFGFFALIVSYIPSVLPTIVVLEGVIVLTVGIVAFFWILKKQG